MRFGRDGVVERTATVAFLNDLRMKFLRQGQTDPYAAFSAGIIKGLVRSILDDRAHMDLLEGDAIVNLTDADVVQKLFDVTVLGDEDIN